MSAPRLGYCLNVHPAETVDEVVALLRGPVARVRRAWRGERASIDRAEPAGESGRGGPGRLDHPTAAPRRGAGEHDQAMGVGLWLPLAAARAVAEDDAARDRVRAALEDEGLVAYTVNAFPIGGFHAARVKSDVYRPTWLEDARLEFTLLACRALARLLPPGAPGSVSTCPITYRAFGVDAAGLASAGARLGRLVDGLARLEVETGHEVAVALEPEPGCALETVAESVDFLLEQVVSGPGRAALVAAGRTAAQADALARRLVGVCVDACHLSVAFEPLDVALELVAAAGLRVVKAQLSSALELVAPATNEAGRRRLAAFAEPRWLHQTTGLDPSTGRRLDADDLPAVLGPDGALAPRFADSPLLRTHCHVPLCWDGDADLGTTRPELEASLAALARATDHLEVETYTFSALPAADRARYGDDVERMVVAELRWAEAALEARGITPS